MHRRSWLAILVVVAVLLTVNLTCWAPGVGSSDGTLPGRPKGTELERYFGWPAQYRAELWHSDDQNLAGQILIAAPFYKPGHEMVCQVRYLGLWAILIDVLFALILSVLAALIVEQSAFEARRRPFVWLGILLLVCLCTLFLAAGHVDVHL